MSETVDISVFDGKMSLIAPDGTQAELIGRWENVEFVCLGAAQHFRADGSCSHSDDWIKACCHGDAPIIVVPFGGRS